MCVPSVMRAFLAFMVVIPFQKSRMWRGGLSCECIYVDHCISINSNFLLFIYLVFRYDGIFKEFKQIVMLK